MMKYITNAQYVLGCHILYRIVGIRRTNEITFVYFWQLASLYAADIY